MVGCGLLCICRFDGCGACWFMLRGFVLESAVAVLDFFVRVDEYNFIIFIREAKCEDLGHKGADLAWGEVNDSGDLAAY